MSAPLRLALPSALALLLVASVAQAQDFRWQKRLAAGSRVRIQNINGNIDVQPASGDQVEVLGFRRESEGGSNPVRAEVHETADGVIICAVKGDMRCDEDGIHGSSRDNNWNRERMDFQVRLPRGLRLATGTVSGDVHVTGAQDGVSASSVSGDVRATDVQGDLRFSSVSGDVRVENARASRLNVNSVSGDVTIDLTALTGQGDLSFSTVSGDLTLTVPKSFDADLEMTTVSGDLNTDFPITLDGRMSRRRLEGRIGKGGRLLKVSTVSGDLKLRGR